MISLKEPTEYECPTRQLGKYMNMEILIAIAGILLSVLTYFAGVQRTERKYREDDASTRQNRVVDYILNIPRGQGNISLIELVNGGALELKDENEFIAVLEKLENRNYRPAFPPQIRTALPAGSLFEFLGWFSKNRLKFADIMNPEKTNQVIDRFLTQREAQPSNSAYRPPVAGSG